MANERRYIPEGEPSVVELTNRTIQSRFLLRPGPELNDIIVGAIARAQRRYDVEVHGYVFLSNHYHLIVTVHSAHQLSSFAGYFQAKIAKEVCKLHGWRDKIWARRYKHIVMVDDDAQIERFRYLLEHGCKEGLVASPLEWPGVHCAGHLTRGEMEVQGTWLDRTRLWAASRRDEEVSDGDCKEVETLRLTALPVWSDKSQTLYAAHVRELIRMIEKNTSERHREQESEPLGPATVRSQDPHRVPIETKREPAPLVHATTKTARLAFRAAYQVFLAACATATERFRATGDPSGFPAGAFLPPLPVAVLDTS